VYLSSVWLLVATQSDRYELLKTVYLDVLLMAFCAYCSHHIERAFRLDFLRQKDFQAEQARTNSIVENILPPHIIAMQMAAVKARRDKAEQELAALAQYSRAQGGNRTFSGGPSRAGGRNNKIAPTNGSPQNSGLGSARSARGSINGGAFDAAGVDVLRRTITSTNRKGGAAQLLLAHSTAGTTPIDDMIPRHLTSPPAHRHHLTSHAPGSAAAGGTPIVGGDLKVMEMSTTDEVKGAHGLGGGASTPMGMDGKLGLLSSNNGDEEELDELGIFSPNAPPLPPGQEIEHFLSKELSDILVSVEGQVSIIFCDILDMTVYMQRHSPSHVVAILDT
jgi:hypothetical protein